MRSISLLPCYYCSNLSLLFSINLTRSGKVFLYDSNFLIYIHKSFWKQLIYADFKSVKGGYYDSSIPFILFPSNINFTYICSVSLFWFILFKSEFVSKLLFLIWDISDFSLSFKFLFVYISLISLNRLFSVLIYLFASENILWTSIKLSWFSISSLLTPLFSKFIYSLYLILLDFLLSLSILL